MDEDDVYVLAGVEIPDQVARARKVVPPAEVAASLRRGFVLESEGVTLPWKVSMHELERFASTFRLDAFGSELDGDYGWSPVRALGGMHLPVVVVTDTHGFGVFDRVNCIFPRDEELSPAGTELFHRLHAMLEVRLGPAAVRELPKALWEARWQLGAVRVALGSVARSLPERDVYRTWIRIDLDPALPFECVGPPTIEPAVEATVEPARSPPAEESDPRPPQGLPSRLDGLREVRVAAVPIFAATYRLSGADQPPCGERCFGFQTWFVGSGVRAAAHPVVLRGDGFLAREITRSRCGGCASGDVWVVAFSTSASMGGDCYYSLELRCEACGSYTSFAYDDR